MTYEQLKISQSQAEAILFRLYGIQAQASPLPGQLDFNFKIKVDGKSTYILKISRPDENLEDLDFQTKLLEHIAAHAPHIPAPKVVPDQDGQSISSIIDDYGRQRSIRLLTWIDGRLWSSVNPQLDELRYSLGQAAGQLTKALSSFSHSRAKREFEWDVAQASWTKDHLHLFNEEEKALLTYFQARFDQNKTAYDQLHKSVVHNDANDNNVLVTADLRAPQVSAIIDYGDAIYTQVINDVAITTAYAIMGHPDPLAAALPIVAAYHEHCPLQAEDLAHLYTAIAMRLVMSVTHSAINKRAEPDNEYLLISEQAAWELLKKWSAIQPDFAYYSFRSACGMCAHPQQRAFEKWTASQSFSLKELFPSVQKEAVYPLDLSVSSAWIGHEQDFNNLALFDFKISQLQAQHSDKIIAGGYLEARPIYTSTTYDKIGNYGRESRTIHLGVDYWLPAGTAVHAILAGEVVMAVNDAGNKEYGGLVVLKHEEDGLTFYSLYGHLSVESALQHQVGDRLEKGELIATLGNYPENGNWSAHLHFQLMHSLLDYEKDFPGVAYYRQLEVWKSLCPDPNLLFKSAALADRQELSNDDIIAYRKKHLGKSLSLQYKVPIKMVRGAGAYLVDQYGRKYLDTVNNVAHVGHEHAAVVKAGQEQMALINTNSRYLHENINELAKELIATLPPSLNVLHFVNSGSEANELAIRMVKAATGQRDIIASEVGYHGNANMCIDISSYKFDGKGGQGAPEHTHIFPLPDAFRGKYRGENTGDDYAREVQACIDRIHAKDRGVGALIVEPIISCGGQVELPDGFLPKAYEYVRAAGGLCISDEVQVGCGRVGKAFWGFQLYGVVPDIVTIGKPLGNGHPLAAVVCTQEVADRFANGMEYFNTFGGNPVSCAIGAAVLKTVKREGLQENALKVGTYLKAELKKLAQEFPIIGDVRGQGLFLGFELVDAQMQPLAEQTDYLANRMKDHGILMSTDGPDHNVLKIKPPIVFAREQAEELVFYLKKVLAEDFMQLE